MDKLELAFTEELKNRAYEAKKKYKYNPTRFLQMLAQYGGWDTAKRLIKDGEISDGFTRLLIEGRLDLTMEAVVIEHRFNDLFSDKEIQICKDKLIASGYKKLKE